MSESHPFANNVWADDPYYWARCPRCGKTEGEHE